MIEYLIVELTISEQQRIFSKISIDKDTGCWNWTGAKIKNRGYGVFNFRGKTESVHRLIYAWMIEPIPKGKRNLVLDHIVCNNRSCCNPAHLKLGTQRTNALRGNSPPSINFHKEYCNRGHLLPKEPNEEWGNNRKGRRCILCRRINANKRYHSRKKM
jgi:hypothetical protein